MEKTLSLEMAAIVQYLKLLSYIIKQNKNISFIIFKFNITVIKIKRKNNAKYNKIYTLKFLYIKFWKSL